MPSYPYASPDLCLVCFTVAACFVLLVLSFGAPAHGGQALPLGTGDDDNDGRCVMLVDTLVTDDDTPEKNDTDAHAADAVEPPLTHPIEGLPPAPRMLQVCEQPFVNVDGKPIPVGQPVCEWRPYANSVPQQ